MVPAHVAGTDHVAEPALRSFTPKNGRRTRTAQGQVGGTGKIVWSRACGSGSGAAEAAVGCHLPSLGDQVWVVDGACVAFGGGDRQAEQVADRADVAAAGVGFVQDAVFVNGLDAAGDAGFQLDPAVPDGAGASAERMVRNRCGLAVSGQRRAR